MTDKTTPMPDDSDGLADIDELADREDLERLKGSKYFENIDEIELIIDYLNGHLDAEQHEVVRKRLEEDDAFRDLAEPLVLTWSVPKHIVRHPRPAGELERDWAEFVRKVGMELPQEVEPPKAPEPPEPTRWERAKAFNRSTGAKLMFLVACGAFIYGGMLARDKFLLANNGSSLVAEDRDYAAVGFDTGWISLGDGIEVQMPRGAALKVDAHNLDGMKHVVLDGEARFRVLPTDGTSRLLRKSALYVETSAGSVWAGEADFTVNARDSVTTVLVHPLGPRRAAMPNLRTVMISSERPFEADYLGLLDTEEGRLVRWRDPVRVASTVPSPK